MNLKYKWNFSLFILLAYYTSCANYQTNDFKCSCSPTKLMEGDVVEVKINKTVFKNLLIEKPNKAYVYLQNQSLDSLWMLQKQFEKTKIFKLNTQLLTDYIYYKEKKLKSRVFDRDGTYKIIFTNANSADNLENEYKYCKVRFEMWK